jgi:hypothetical protein
MTNPVYLLSYHFKWAWIKNASSKLNVKYFKYFNLKYFSFFIFLSSRREYYIGPVFRGREGAFVPPCKKASDLNVSMINTLDLLCGPVVKVPG